MFSDDLTSEEAMNAKSIYQELQQTHSQHSFIKKIKPLIDQIDAKKIDPKFIPQALGNLFELTFFHKLVKSGKVSGEIDHEFKGLDASRTSVDFRFATDVDWNVELTTLRHNNTLKEKACSEDDGLTIFRGGSKELSLEIKRAQSVLINKLHNENGENIKFPLPKKDQFHVLGIDMKSFQMSTHCDIYDCRSICYGYEVLSPNGALYFNDKLIPGLFEESHPEPKSKSIRERIHFIIFFGCQDYRGNPKIVPTVNLRLFKDREEASRVFKLFPFKE